MKQIPFNPELIGTPGITVKVDGEVPDFIKYYPNQSYPVVVIDKAGISYAYAKKAEYLTMYRQTRSAEEIAKEVYKNLTSDSQLDHTFNNWDRLTVFSQKFYTALVQNGMDEVTDKNE
jgi:hypothetical protein